MCVRVSGVLMRIESFAAALYALHSADTNQILCASVTMDIHGKQSEEEMMEHEFEACPNRLLPCAWPGTCTSHIAWYEHSVHIACL